EALPASHSLYYNADGRAALLAFRPELLTAEDKEANSERARSFVQAVQNPKLFRQLDRQYRFDTLFLVGDPSTYWPLLQHLIEADDWSVSYLDHTSLVLRRGKADVWTEDKLDPLRAKFATASADDRGMFLSAVAVKAIMLRKFALGKKLGEEAEQIAPRLPDPWSAMSRYHLERGEWNPAVADADRALDIEDDFAPALASKTQALFASKHFEDAYHLSERLVELRPDDPEILFYHAKICHEARAFGEEVKALQKLITLADAAKRPTTGYRTYLGQAFAREGKGPEAMEQFEQALTDPEISKDQRTQIQADMGQIRSHLQSKN
ncbi:MAG TPA: hypothetical protein VGH90_13455, partial [Chthoniobacteraceae bacterium]